ncbi:MAG: ATP-binding protein, partial [Clostridium sp.]
RNAAIAEAFHYMHIIEAWGTGIPRIINRCKEYGLKEPLFEEFGDGFKVTLFRKVINGVVKVSNAVENISNGLSELGNALKIVGNDVQKKGNDFAVYLGSCEKVEITPTFVSNIEIVFRKTGTEQIFSQGDIQVLLACSKSKATNVINAMKKAEIVTKVKGFGPGKYKFVKTI